MVIHGLAGSYDPNSVSAGSKHMYTLGFLLASTTGGLIYFILVKIWPVQIYPGTNMPPTTFEYMGANDGYFEDDVIMGVESVDSTLEEVHFNEKF
jgi:NCS1 family nucleobase:cation symporter-1